MISDRPYRTALSAPQALAELERCAGSQFDREVVSVLAALVKEGLGQQRLTERAP